MLKIGINYLDTEIVSMKVPLNSLKDKIAYAVNIAFYPGNDPSHNFLGITYGLATNEGGNNIEFAIEARFIVLGEDRKRLTNTLNPSSKSIIAELLFFSHAQLIALFKEKMRDTEFNDIVIPMRFLNDFANMTISVHNRN